MKDPETQSAEGDTLREACGVFGVYAPGQMVSHLVFDGLYALQHRGQESAGIAVSDTDQVTVMRDMGLVTNVFDEKTLRSLVGDLAIGHTRYSTTGSSSWQNAQPIYKETRIGAGFAIGHNGNLTNTADVAKKFGIRYESGMSDTAITAELIAREVDRIMAAADDKANENKVIETAISNVMTELQGAFSFVILTPTQVIGVRDPNGFRPLCLGKLDEGWVLASETPALDVIGSSFVREIDPGELVAIDADGVRSERPYSQDAVDPKLCIFEFVYLARPDSKLYGKETYGTRVQMGRNLAMRSPLPPSKKYPDAEVMVMGIPDSALPAAEGFALESGYRYGTGLVKNRYIGRTFISPTPQARAVGVKRKFNPLKEHVNGKRLVVIDDSIVRGTTTRSVVEMLRQAGALEVHIRISSPPYKWPCFYGIDTGSRTQLLAANMDMEEIKQYLNVDSISYLSLSDLRSAIGVGNDGFCDACLTGNYPCPIPSDEAAIALDCD